jgi:penicillin G amidase
VKTSIALLLALSACGDNIKGEPDGGPPAETLTLDGLDAAVDVTYDDRGVPHIYGTTVHDVLLVQGYLMAKDRFGQMEFIRRSVLGRLAEVAGALQPSLVQSDQESRFLGFGRQGKAIYDSLPATAPSRRGAEAFVAGINQWIDTQILVDGYVAPEGLEAMALIKGSPFFGHWKPEDIFALARYQSWNLSYDAESDINRTAAVTGVLTAFPAISVDARLSARAGAYADMFTDRPARAAFTIDPANLQAKRPGKPPPSAKVPAATLAGAATFFDGFATNPMLRRDPHVGSNSWVVAGAATATGNPILSNDPHLSLIAPPVWWYVHLNTADKNGERALDTEGVAFAGLPGVVLGFNRKLAWSATTTGYDVTDVYAETVTFRNDGTLAAPVWTPLSVRFNNADVALETVDEPIYVQGATAPQTFRLYVVPHHGTIIPTSLTPPSAPGGTQGFALSVRYTGDDVSDELTYFNGLWDADSFADAKAAQENFEVGSQNFSFASATDGIRWSSRARVPQRQPAACTFAYSAAGIPSGVSPQFILDGSGGFEWTTDLASDSVPHEENPARKYIATSNQDNIGNTADGNPCNDAIYLGGDFDVGYRQARIRERLDAAVAAGGITTADMSKLQSETKSPLGEGMRTAVVAALDHALGNTVDDPVLAAAVTAIGPAGVAVLTDARARLVAWSLQTPHGVGATAQAEVDDSIATTVWNVTLTRLAPLVLADETSRIMRQPGTLQAARLLEWMLTTPATLATYRASYAGDITYNDSVLWDDLATTLVTETRDERIVRAVVAAYGFLDGKLGTDRTQWRWGRLHAVRFEQVVPSLTGTDAISIPPSDSSEFPAGFPRHGDLGAVDPGNYSIYNTTNFGFASGASQRLVVEMTPSGPKAFNAIPGGQVEVPADPHHADEAEHWRKNEAPPLYFDKADVDAHATKRVTFTPK